MLPVIAELENSLEIQSLISGLARELTIDEATIAAELNKYLSGRKKYSAPLFVPSPPGGRYKGRNVRTEAEKQLIWALAQIADAPRLINDLKTRLNGRYADIRQETRTGGDARSQSAALCFPALEEIAGLLPGQAKKTSAGEKLAAILPYLSDEGGAKVAQLLTDGASLLVEEAKGADIGQLAKDCVKQLEKAFWEQKYDEHRKLAAEYERAGDGRFAGELAKSQEIKNEIRKLF
jgi:hypothetical protein